ncbi:MAG: hypothetical protein HY056_02285 [Proteobacteria bacterium]|nr:hypothetical protein [Pseudomonadota bacterium]
MRKLAIVLAVLMAAASVGTAFAAQKGAKAKPAAAPAGPNEAGWRLVKEIFPLFLPAGGTVAYLATQEARSSAAKKR